MYFDGSIYPHLPQPLLDRIPRIRALVDHATADLTAALGHIDAISQLSPRQLKGKGKRIPPVPRDPADDPITGTSQADLIHWIMQENVPHCDPDLLLTIDQLSPKDPAFGKAVALDSWGASCKVEEVSYETLVFETLILGGVAFVLLRRECLRESVPSLWEGKRAGVKCGASLGAG